MKAALLPLLFLLAGSAHAAADGPRTKACKVTDLSNIGTIIPPHVEWDAGEQRRVTIVTNVGTNGALEAIAINRSSQSRGYDVAAREHARGIRLSGDCLRHGKGLLYLQYVFRSPDDVGQIESAWRESSSP